MKPKFVIVPNLKNEYLLMMKDEVLKTNNIKVGDKVLWNFKYHTVRPAYKGRGMDRYYVNEISEGVLKLDDNGYLFVESLKDYPFYNYTNNGMTGRQRKEWYQREMKKSTHFFGVGFIHKQ